MAVDRRAIDEERRSKFWKPEEGKNFIFLLPPTEGRRKPWIEIYMHYGVGLNNASVVCPAKMENKRCPICEKGRSLYEKGTEESKKLARQYFPKLVYVAAIVDLRDPDLRPQLWRFGKTVKRYLVDCFYDDEDPDKFIDYTDMDNGYKVILTRVDKSATENYIDYSAKLGKPYSFDKKKQREILSNIPSLSELAKCLSYKEIYELLTASEYIDEEDEEFASDDNVVTNRLEEEEEEPPAPKKEEEDDLNYDTEEEEVEEEEEEEAPKPVKKSKKTKKTLIPAGAPSCFGREYDPDDDECLECEYEIECHKTFSRKRV